jgi:hypothetical protein
MMMAGSFGGLVGTDGEGGKNFVIEGGKGGGGQPGQQQGLPGQANKPRGLSREQQEEAKVING